mgnify:CR=1 FL=1
MKLMSCDILIVGSGLTGLVTAYSLSLLGFKIILTDKKKIINILKNCLLSAAEQLHRPLSWLCFQMYALLLLQLMDHRKQVTRLGIPFRPEHPYETHARLAGFNTTSSLQACPKTAFTPMR